VPSCYSAWRSPFLVPCLVLMLLLFIYACHPSSLLLYLYTFTTCVLVPLFTTFVEFTCLLELCAFFFYSCMSCTITMYCLPCMPGLCICCYCLPTMECCYIHSLEVWVCIPACMLLECAALLHAWSILEFPSFWRCYGVLLGVSSVYTVYSALFRYLLLNYYTYVYCR